MPTNEEMITLADAEKRYGISRDGIYYHVRKGNLKTYKKLGDKRSYLKVSELDTLAGFRPSDENVYRPNPEELADLLERIAAADQVPSMTREQVKAELAKLKATRRTKRANRAIA